MDRLNLKAEERALLGKKVKSLRKEGFLPAHVFGKGLDTEHVTVNLKEFSKVYDAAGATGLVDLKIGAEKVRPVMVRGVQYNPVSGNPVHIDFYQVNLNQKVRVPVPIELIGEEPESVHLGESIVLQTLNEVEVEALPTDLIEKIEVDISTLKNIDDAVTVGNLNYDREKLTIEIDSEEVVVKLAPAVTAEMEQLLEEQAADVAAAAEEAAAAEGAEKPEGEEGVEGEGGEVKEGEEGEEAPVEGETQQAVSSGNGGESKPKED